MSEKEIVARLARDGVLVATVRDGLGRPFQSVYFYKWRGQDEVLAYLHRLPDVAHIHLPKRQLSERAWGYLSSLKSLWLVDVTEARVPSTVVVDLKENNPQVEFFDARERTKPLEISNEGSLQAEKAVRSINSAELQVP